MSELRFKGILKNLSKKLKDFKKCSNPFDVAHGLIIDGKNASEGVFTPLEGTIQAKTKNGESVLIYIAPATDEFAEYTKPVEDPDLPVDFPVNVNTVTYNGETVELTEFDEAFNIAVGSDWVVTVDADYQTAEDGYLFAAFFEKSELAENYF